MKNIIIILLLLPFTFYESAEVLINQAGYLPGSAKFVYVTESSDSFYVHSLSNEIVYRNKLELWSLNDASTGMSVYEGDFSEFKETGNFFITTDTGDSSYIFEISNSVFEQVYKKTLKAFYYQRCGFDLLGSFADPYYHLACHKADGFFHSTTGLTGFNSASGGWHDAGDFGKYVVNAGITVGTLLMAYETFPQRFTYDDLNIPESGNNIPDILDEVKYELDWLFKMQNVNGGVYAKLTKNDFAGFIMPQNDSGIRYIYQIASTATADFAANMARAYRVYLPFDSVYANKCLNAAKLAWTFLGNNPSIVPSGGFKSPQGTNTGEYGDGDDKDERLWAAAELFMADGDQKYNSFFVSHYKDAAIFSGPMSWANVRSMAHLTYLAGNRNSINSSIQNEELQALKNYCNTLVSRGSNDGFHVTLTSNEYNWGSNSGVLNEAVLLLFGYNKLHVDSYLNTALNQLNYILGTNAHNMSFVTGIGTKYPMHPHHRVSDSDGITEPIPGLLAGGPNKYLNDDVLKIHFNNSTPPALCYVDITGSYASNEIAINWNAPLVFVAGYFNNEKNYTDVKTGRLEIPDKIQLEQNFPNPFNNNTTISFYLNEMQNVNFLIYNSLGVLVTYKHLGILQLGKNQFNWNAVNDNGNQLSSGIYYYQIEGNEKSFVKKLVLLK